MPHKSLSSPAWLNFSLASAPAGKASEEIKGGSHDEGSKREGTRLLYLHDPSVTIQNTKGRGVYETNLIRMSTLFMSI